MKAKTFEKKFEQCIDLTKNLDLAKAQRINRKIKRVNIDFPEWMVVSLDLEAQNLGITRQSLIKVWIAKNLQTLP